MICNIILCLEELAAGWARKQTVARVPVRL